VTIPSRFGSLEAKIIRFPDASAVFEYRTLSVDPIAFGRARLEAPIRHEALVAELALRLAELHPEAEPITGDRSHQGNDEPARGESRPGSQPCGTKKNS